MRKALILGAGGTGARVITNIANLIDARKKESIKNLDYLKYYEMDTAPPDSNDFIPNSEHDYAHMTVSQDQDDAFKKLCEKGKHKWADPNIVTTIDNGAASIRMMGKYGFLHHYDKIKEEVLARLKRLNNYKLDTINTKTQIYIVANTASGTGSGCFLDLGMMVKDLIRQNDFLSTDPNLRVTLIITIAADSQNADHLRNSYFALQELNHFMMGNSYEIDHIKAEKKIVFNEKSERNRRPFDFVYLIGPRVAVGTLTVTHLENLISEYIYNDIYSPSAAVRDGRRDDLKKYIDITDPVGQRPLYMSLGLSTIEYPSVKILEAASYKYILRSIEDWNKPINISQANSSSFEREYFDETIYKDMIAKCTIGGVDLNYELKLKATKDRAEGEFKNNNFDSDYLRKLTKEYESGFLNQAISRASSTIQPGDIQHIINTNHAILINALSDRVKESVLEILFSGRPGSIESAKNVTQNIINKLQSFVNPEIDSTACETTEKNMTAICGHIEQIKQDPLLPGIFKSAPIKKLLRSFMKNFDRYTDIKLKNEIAEKLRFDSNRKEDTKLFSKLTNNLKIFQENTDAFKNRMESWKNKAEKKFDEAVKTPTINGHIVNRNEIEKLSEKTVIGANVPSTDLITKYLKVKYYKYTDENGAEKYGDLMEEKNKDFNYTNDDIFSSVKEAHRNYIENKDVIEAFLDEQKKLKNSEDDSDSLGYAYEKVNEVYNKSQWFAEVDEEDPNFKIDDPKLQKLEWVFYPDGNEVKTEEDAKKGMNRFAKILYERAIIADEKWADKSQSSNSSATDKNMILFLREKGLFPIRLLKILRSENMTTALTTTAINIKNTFQSRMDIENFMPLIPPEKDNIDDIKQLLIKSIAAENIEVRDGGKFKMNGEDIPFDLKDFGIPVEYNAAVTFLDSNTPLKKVMQAAFNAYYLDMKLAAEDDPGDKASINFVIRLHDIKHRPGKFGLAVTNKDDRTDIERLIVGNLGKDDRLREIWNRLYPDERIGSSGDTIDKSVKLIEITDDDYPTKGYYCINESADGEACGFYLGNNENSLPEKCPACQKKLIK